MGRGLEPRESLSRQPVKSHLADDFSILRYEDLYWGTIGGSAQHTHGGHLQGQEETDGS